MLNFDCILKTSKGDLAIKDNNYKFSFEPSAQQTHQLIDLYQHKIADGDNLLKALSFDELVKAIPYRQEATFCLNSLQKNLCRSAFKSKTFSDFCLKTDLNERLAFQDLNLRVTLSQGIVLNRLSNGKVDGGYLDWDSLYDVRNDKDKSRAVYDELTSFPFRKYGIDFEIGDDHKDLQKNIELFRQIKTNEGNKIVNWGSHKITSYLKSIDQRSNYTLRLWLREYQDFLKEKGVTLTDGKTKKTDIRAKWDAWNQAHASSSQSDPAPWKFSDEETLYIIKNLGRWETKSAIRNCSKAVLLAVITSDLKCIENKIFEGDIGGAILNRGSDLFGIEEHNIFLKYIKNSLTGWGDISVDYILKVNSVISDSDLTDFFQRNDREVKEGLSERLKSLPKFTLNNSITTYHISNMSFQERIKSLIDLDKKGSKINWDNIGKLYAEIPYNTLKPSLEQLSKDTLYALSNIIIKNNDASLAEHYFRTPSHRPCSELFSILPPDIKLDLFKSKSVKDLNCIDHIPQQLLPEIIKISKDFIEGCFEHGNYQELSDALISRKLNFGQLLENRISTDTIKLFSKELKIKILKEHENVLFTQNNSWEARYSHYDSVSSNKVHDLTSSLTRQEVVALFGERYKSRVYCGYFFTIMTDEERIEQAETNPAFLRKFVKELPYISLQKYKKEAERFKNKKPLAKDSILRIVAGDLRKHRNRDFICDLLKRLDVPVSIDWLISLGDEYNSDSED